VRSFLDAAAGWRLPELPADAAWSARRMQAHTLRGTAGNLALEEIAQLGATLEAAARRGDESGYVAARVQLVDAFERADAAAAETASSLGEDPGIEAPTSLPVESVLVGIDEILQALRRGEMAESQLARLAAALPDPRLESAQQAMAEFDNDSAERHLLALREALVASHPETEG
jgi:HPt (histidine-containing phosphotransfer) domain-containing protein